MPHLAGASPAEARSKQQSPSERNFGRGRRPNPRKSPARSLANPLLVVPGGARRSESADPRRRDDEEGADGHQRQDILNETGHGVLLWKSHIDLDMFLICYINVPVNRTATTPPGGDGSFEEDGGLRHAV